MDSSIEEIKRRADSGEFTPKKGVDYFTEEDKTELMEGVSSGAVGEFRKVVDTATTEYNANASEKLTAYDTNAEQHTTDYNRNAEQKLEAYNSNHAAKVAEYNANAETKTAEFDSNAAALQTEVDRLRGECDQLAKENRKQENRISALLKLNKGQTYDILPEEGESASRTAPSGAKYVSVDKVGGKSVVWNQQLKLDRVTDHNGITASLNNDGSITINGTATSDAYVLIDSRGAFKLNENHKYLYKGCPSGGSGIGYFLGDGWSSMGRDYGSGTIFTATSGTFQPNITVREGNTVSNLKFKPNLFDITKMFGSTIADYVYSLEKSQAGAGVSWFKKLFPADYYPYSEPTIISSQTDRVDVVSADGTITQQITTGFPVLNSAGSVYDYIDLNDGKHRQRVGVVDLGTLSWRYSEPDGWHQVVFKNRGRNNLLCDRYKTDKYELLNDKTIGCNSSYLVVVDTSYTDGNALKQALQGVMLYYGLAEEVITDITIPTELSDWLTVEAGGSVTFHNADESKQLAVPNAVSWVRKLDEVN